MAAFRTPVMISVLRAGISRPNTLSHSSSNARGNVRNLHILPKEDKEAKIVMADNGATIVCWHPAPEFPYECSLPLPPPTATTDVNQVLKASFDDVRDQFEKVKPQMQREYLQRVTATTKHRWFPRPGKKFAKKNDPDREYL